MCVKDECQAAGVPFFFKQWGGVQKKKTGRLLDGLTYDEYPDRVQVHDPVLDLKSRHAANQEITEKYHLDQLMETSSSSEVVGKISLDQVDSLSDESDSDCRGVS